MIIGQVNRDNDVGSFLTKMNQILSGRPWDIKSMKTVVACICEQTSECSYFIRKYAQDTKFRELACRCGYLCKLNHLLIQGTRLNLLSDIDEHVRTYNNAFDSLMQQFRDRATRDTLVVVHRIWEDVKNQGNVFSDRICHTRFDSLDDVAADFDLNSMPYVSRAGLERKKSFGGHAEKSLPRSLLGSIASRITHPAYSGFTAVLAMPNHPSLTLLLIASKGWNALDLAIVSTAMKWPTTGQENLHNNCTRSC